MIRDDIIVWEPSGTEAETTAGTARPYRKQLKAFRWCDLKVLFTDTLNEWYKHKAPALRRITCVLHVALPGAASGRDCCARRCRVW
jgi:hypothetical protein